MTPEKTYDLAQVFLTLNGIRIAGFGEEGAVEFESVADIGEHIVSADGQVVFSRNNDKRVIATITVLETSRSARDLDEMRRAQEAAPSIVPLVFYMQDTISGDEISEQYATFLNRPMPSKGKGAGEREFRLVLPYGGDTALLAPLITI